MFQSERRRSAGLVSLVAVAVVLVAWLGTAGVLVKAFREGGARLPQQDGCELVCRQTLPQIKG